MTIEIRPVVARVEVKKAGSSNSETVKLPLAVVAEQNAKAAAETATQKATEAGLASNSADQKATLAAQHAASAENSKNSAASSAAAAEASATTAVAAATLSVGPNGGLKNAIRTLGFQPRRAGGLPANDQPTLTLGVSGAVSAIDGASQSNPRIARSDPRLNYVSGVPMLFGTTFPRYNFFTSRGAFYGYSDAGNTTPLRGTAYFAYEFIHTGTQFEIPTLGNGNSGVNFRILVNGCVAGTLSNPNGDGGGRLNRVQFPTHGTRLIRVETGGVPCNGVHVADSAEISASNRNYPLVTLIGDSFVEGSGSDVGDLSAVVTARALGFNPALAGVGATGMINAGNNNTSGFPKVPWTHAERLRDLTLEGVTDPRTGQSVTANVAAGIVFASVNDQGLAAGVWGAFGATLTQAITNRLDVLIDDWVRVHGTKPLFLFGPTWASGLPNNSPPLDIFRIRDGVQQAAEGRAGSSLFFIDRLMPARRQGVRSNASDQASLYTGTDGTHPSADGHRFDGLTDAEALRQQILMA